jgi:DNA-directed RNA polymerase subunit RPC12/RpoP
VSTPQRRTWRKETLTRCRWDTALAQHQLRASDQYIACLNAKCGHHFSIEDCNKKTSRKKKIACPYCEYELCIDCNRPWHPRSGCDKNKTAENEMSEDAIKSLGAKPCPNCGVKIDKISGCDHMTCKFSKPFAPAKCIRLT